MNQTHHRGSPRAQNRHFCAFFSSMTPIFWPFEHKNWLFVRFLPSEPSISGFSSTKSAFLCAFGLRNPRFQAFRAQNRGFCVRMGDFSEIFGRFDTKMGFLCSRSITMVVPANHRARQCAPEVRRTGIRARGDLQELLQGQAAASSGTQHLRPARRQPYSAEIRRWRRQSVQMGR